MKQIVGIMAVAALAVGVFFVDTTKSNYEVNLASLIQDANADCEIWAWPQKCNSFGRCSSFGSGGGCDVR
ncbi:hypothetical protein [Sinomicrobium weinanense]|uniref:NVEALA family protein n=1 Tax=Sinomicrobium weinanense TaxID=2842200 RepID=A0A926JVW3_9FLAO|nr:hypothetical protein [Sinomicrobium weinanense]MBC9798555.1 hypothetical protein [Sinomicrobium weinanense]MBU3125972.1 hypothetical protein [Sinomicrobium weinanense]